MRRPNQPLSIEQFSSLLLGAPDGERCMNAQFLLHLERAVREIRREHRRPARHSSAAARAPQSVPYGTELN
jgi:hypothetical protein